jgi:hypothetical protein
MALFRIILGAIIGYALSLVSSVGWFAATHHLLVETASTKFILATAVVGIIASIVCGYIGSLIGASVNAGYGVAVLILLASIASLIEGGVGNITLAGNWSQWIAILLMAPAAYLGAKLYRKSPAL